MESWDLELIRRQGAGSLVAIARAGHLARGPVPVDLNWVDEVSLALIDHALRSRRSLSLVYPSPAGEVSALLAAQILIQKAITLGDKFKRGEILPAVGIVTADTTGATRAWEQLRVGPSGARTPISETFPCYRTGPDGESPFGKHPFRGVLIGRKSRDWRVDAVIIDPFAGPVFGDPPPPTIRLYADPLDAALNQLADRGDLIWGWSEETLAQNSALEVRGNGSAPFSVGHERFQTIAAGVSVTIRTTRHAAAELYVRRLRDDLRTLAGFAGADAPRHIRKGLAVAWHHVSTLSSLPCRPSEFDRFAGQPPWAARATASFEQEIAAWARTLSGDLGEIAGIIASDLGDLRAALEDANPFVHELSRVAQEARETLVIVKTRTAAKGLIAALGGDPDETEIGPLHVCAIGKLHRERTWDRAIAVGIPARWDWHRFDSGISRQVEVIVLGEADTAAARGIVGALKIGRARWGGAETRAHVWRELLKEAPPPMPAEPAPVARPVVVLEGHEIVPEADPFDALGDLGVSEPLSIGDNGLEESLAHQNEDGEWRGAVEAVEIVTDEGVIKLPRDRIVEVRDGHRIADYQAQAIEPGMYLLIGRRAGRIGLIEALEDRLKHRPDLLAARLLIADYQAHVQRTFVKSGLTITKLHQKLVKLGCDKTLFAVRSWVLPDGSMAPRDLPDLRLLNTALDLALSDRRVGEIFAAVQRRRTFRRAAGRALSEAARQSAVVTDQTRVDPDTGLSIADLRDAVVEARVIDVQLCPSPVPITELGHLERGA